MTETAQGIMAREEHTENVMAEVQNKYTIYLWLNSERLFEEHQSEAEPNGETWMALLGTRAWWFANPAVDYHDLTILLGPSVAFCDKDTAAHFPW